MQFQVEAVAPEVFSKKHVLKNFNKFTGKHLYRGLIFLVLFKNKRPKCPFFVISDNAVIYSRLLPGNGRSRCRSSDGVQMILFVFRLCLQSKKHLDVFKLWIDTCFHVFLGVMRWILRFINSIKPRSFIASFRSLFRTQSNIYDGAILRK